MLRLTKKLLFAIEAVLDIAYNVGTLPVQSSEITRRQGIPRRYLEQVRQRADPHLACRAGSVAAAVGAVVDTPYLGAEHGREVLVLCEIREHLLDRLREVLGYVHGLHRASLLGLCKAVRTRAQRVEGCRTGMGGLGGSSADV